MNRFEYHIAESLEDAGRMAGEGAALKAGGVDWIDLAKSGLSATERVVSIHAVEGHAQIERENARVHIGALATLAAIERSPVIREALPALAQACADAATPQVREMATLGGNLCQRPRCWYFRHPDFTCLKKGGTQCHAQEGENEFHAIFENSPCAIVHASNAAVPLLAYGATIVTTRREIPIERFFVLPSQDISRENVLEAGELIREVAVSVPSGRSAYCEVRHKQSFDWALASAAVVLGDDPRVAVGAVAPVPMRRPDVERALAQGAEAAARAAGEGARTLSKNAYKVRLIRVAVKRAIERAQS